MKPRPMWIISRKIASLRYRDLRRRDRWFYSHFVLAAGEIREHLGQFLSLKGSRVLDFGCGDGFTALGVSRFKPKEIIGVDLNDAFRYLPEITRRYLGRDALPRSLSLQQVKDGEPLPFETGTFDAAYAWSVLEHVRDVKGVLRELHRVLKPEGILFIQIEPLYHSTFGSHLERLIPEPWAHLIMSEETFLARAWSARDQIGEDEKDLAYQKNTFADFKKFLISEYRSLNRITADELSAAARDCGFAVLDAEKRRGHTCQPPPDLLARYREDDLLTNEVRLMLRKIE